MPAAGLLAGLAIAEACLRLIGSDRGGIFTVTADDFARLPGILAPGQSAIIAPAPALRHLVRTDSLGYRGSDFPRAKPPQEVRILFAGDSFVYGDFVDDHETLPAQLNQLLSDRCGVPVRVVNAGLGGSTISDQAFLIERGIAIEPNLVILQFGENDVSDLAAPSMWDRLAQNRAAKSGFPLVILYPLVRNTALWSLALRTVSVVRSNRSQEAVTEAAPGIAPTRRYRDEYARRLRSLRDDLRNQGLPLVLTIFPSYLSVYGRWDSDQIEWIEGVAAELEIEFVSFLPALQRDGRGEQELYLLPDDGHASASGYRVAAHELAGRLAVSPHLPEMCE